MKALTKTQRAILDMVSSTIRTTGTAPTYREIQQSFGYASPNTVKCHLQAIEAKGLIRVRPFEPRGISVVNELLLETGTR